MKDRKIIKALSKLNVYELNSFRKFLISPYFNQNEACIAFFDLINDALRNDQNFEELSNEVIWQKVYGDVPYVDVKLRKLSSDLFALFEDYIAQKAMEGDEALTLYLKLKAYKNRNLKDLYSSAVAMVEYSNKKQKDKNAAFYLNQFNVEKTLLDLKEQDVMIDRKTNLESDVNLEEISINLDVFYIAEKLKYYVTLLDFNKNYNLNKKILGIELILKLAKSPVFRDYPPIAIYYTVSLSLTEEQNEEHFFKLKDLINKYLYLFPEQEAKVIFEHCITYAITKSNKGINLFEKEAFELYNKGLDEKLLLFENKISTTNFRNIVGLACKISEYDWVENFIQTYAIHLDEKIRESNVSFCMARLEWYRKDFKKVIGHLVNTEYTEVFQALLSRTLLLLSYYELREIESLSFLLNSFKLYLDREKTLASQRKTPYYNLIKHVRILIKYSSKDKAKLTKLNNDVLNTEWIVSKTWLLDKIDELLIK
jgi:hypothetical protein